jgi:outer membrane protein assembly factor BamB
MTVKKIVLFLSLATIGHGQSTFHGNVTRSGVFSGPEPRQFHRVKWKFPTGNRIVGSAVTDGKAIYFGSDDGNVYAVDPDSGHQIWKYPTKGPVSSTPAIANGMIYVVSFDGKLYALDAAAGTTKWKFATEGERRFEAKNLHGMEPKNQTIPDVFDTYLSSPLVVDDTVFFGSGDGNVYAVHADNGELKWKFKTGDVVHASPAYADGLIYVGSWDSYFYAVDAATGKERWRFHGGEDPTIHNQVGFQSSAAVVGGTVYTGCRDSNVYALDAATGKEKWSNFNDLSWVNTTPAVADGKVYFGTSDSKLFKIVDAATGKELAKQVDKANIFSSPAVVGNTVLIGITNGTLAARDAKNGELLWEYEIEKSKQNRGWILTSDRQFDVPLSFYSAAQEVTTIAFYRQMEAGAIYSSPLVANGVVYCGSGDGYLYAIE